MSSRRCSIGANEEAASLAQQLLAWSTSGLYLVGAVDDRSAPGAPVCGGLTVLGGIEALDDLIARHGVGELVVATSAVSRSRIVDLFRRYGRRDDLSLNLSSGLFELVTTSVSLKEIAAVPLVRVNPVQLNGVNETLKTLLDLVVGALSLLATLPLFAAHCLDHPRFLARPRDLPPPRFGA